MEIIKLLLDLSKQYPIISTICIGAAFGIAFFLMLLFVLQQMDKKFNNFETKITQDYDRRYGFMEKDIKETHELGLLFYGRKDKCDEIQASLPVIRELMGKEDKKNSDIIELIRSEIKLAMGEIVNLEQNMRDILAGLR